ncbi:TetR/AcrR family transcriptional regulator [Rhizobium sp.]
MATQFESQPGEALPARGNAGKRDLIIGATADAICRHGFSGACIDDIADRAKVSRQTIYNNYRDRNALFGAVIEEVMTRANASVFDLLAGFPETGENLEDNLVEFLVSLSLNCVLNKDGRFLRKLVQTEGDRHPELFESWRKHGPLKMVSALGACLAKLTAKGVLEIDDFDVAARQLLALGHADIQMQVLLGETPSDDELERAARNATRTFLRAYAPAAPVPSTGRALASA